MDEVVIGKAETRADLLTENASRKGKEKNPRKAKICKRSQTYVTTAIDSKPLRA